MHSTGFEPVTSIGKRIMSPVPLTTRPRMQFLELMGFEPTSI